MGGFGDGADIGCGSIILPGAKIGKGAIVTLETDGADEQECFDALVELIDARFGESE